MTTEVDPLLVRIDAYLDTVPRSVTTAEQVGPFTLFVNRGNGWRYYARPRPGQTRFTIDDVEAVLDRQRALSQPLAIEWVDDLTPEVTEATRAADMSVSHMPLMHLRPEDLRTATVENGIDVHMVTAEDDVATATAVATVGFGSPGTEVGPAGSEAVAGAISAIAASTLEFTRERLREGFTVMAVATLDGVPVASGSHQPTSGATEITGVAVLPAYRRRGLGAAVTAALVHDATEQGVGTVFLSAGSEEVARVYERVGFHRVGRAGAAEPAQSVGQPSMR